MNYSLIQTILTILGSGAFFGFIQFLIDRRDNRNERIKKLEETVQEGLLEKDKKDKELETSHQQSVQELKECIESLAKTTQEQQRYMTCMGDILVGLVQDKIVDSTKKYQKRGAITLTEKSVLEALYVPYHEGLGGNGRGKAGYEFCQKLPIISDQEAYELDKKHA